MALHMNRLSQNANWRLNPQHREKYNFFERARDPNGNLLTGNAGKKKTVERYMPVPYDMGVSLSMWTSNNDEGYQLLEQITTVFNPDMDIQLSNSPADWTFLTSLIFEGDVEMEKAVPSGSSTDPLYIFKLNFSTVIWMSPPAKVYDTTYIYEVDVPIKQIENSLNFDEMGMLDGLVIRASDDDVVFFESLGEGKTPTQI